MLGYRGEMSECHLRAAIRVALAARGFDLDSKNVGDGSVTQWRNGARVWQEILAAGTFGCDNPVSDLKPEFRDRVPLIADLGFRQTSLFQSLIGPENSQSAQTAFLGAAFNTAITYIDHVSDDLAGAGELFASIDAALIRSIFVAPNEAQTRLNELIQKSTDPSQRFALGLISLCAAKGWELVLATGNQSAWQDLARTMALLLTSQREVAFASWPNYDEVCHLLPFLETKSCGPSVAQLYIARLGFPAATCADTNLPELAKRLGHIFWRIDDLVDLLHDIRCGVPNALAHQIATRLATARRALATDSDIYGEIESVAGELAELAQFESSEALSHFANWVIAGWVPPLSRHFFRSGSKPIPFSLREMSSAALANLLFHQTEGFQEAIHHLHFPRLIDGKEEYQTCPAILSHRAVILDAFLDAAAAGLHCPDQVLAAECMAILRAKHPDVRGGWSYVQDARELPPDADDLGQVLQVLMRLGGSHLASICDEPLRLLLDSAEPDGGFCTWILDPAGQSVADDLMRRYLGVMGGWGVHPEVVANLLYGLLLYDPLRYREPLHRGARYLENAQQSDGGWASKWYIGPYYGSWRAASVLGVVIPDSPSLERLAAFLVSNRNADSGWGKDSSDAISTALAILALTCQGVPSNPSVIREGLRWLAINQPPNGAWPSLPWIHFPTIDGPVTYGSSCITSAFCLKAFIAASSVLPSDTELFHSLVDKQEVP